MAVAATKKKNSSSSDVAALASPPVNNSKNMSEQDGRTYNNDNRGWRSRGWCPLVYPRSALFDEQDDNDNNNGTPSAALATNGEGEEKRKRREKNQFFPLHRHVLTAAVRELLLVEGTLNKSNLSVNITNHVWLVEKDELVSSTSASTTNNTPSSPPNRGTPVAPASTQVPRYKLHLHPDQYELCKYKLYDDEDRMALLCKKRKLESSNKMTKRKSNMKNKRQKVSQNTSNTTTTNDDDAGLIATQSRLDNNKDDDEDEFFCTAESLVDRILDRVFAGIHSYRPEQKNGTDSVLKTDEANDVDFIGPRRILDEKNNHFRPPRKVSDSDATDDTRYDSCFSSSSSATTLCGARDVSRFWKEPGGRTPSPGDESTDQTEEDIPNLLEASIATESSLRIYSRSMMERLLSTFDDKSLRRFLGYKTPSVIRPKLVEAIADYLFDTSHAMFAWQQTEREVLISQPSSSGEKGNIDDTMIRDSLFDTRALKKIGGFDDSSLLPHAIFIGRLKKECGSWQDFAASVQGKRMLEHHQSTESGDRVGARRRGQRLRQRSPSTDASSSPPSYQQPQRSRSSSFATIDTDYGGTGTLTLPDPIIAEMPSTIDVRLKRSEGTSWGILLGREGDLCVVLRGGSAPSVRAGDLVLRVENERGEGAVSPSFKNSSIQAPDMGAGTCCWFDRICDIFKSSNEISLVIQRV